MNDNMSPADVAAVVGNTDRNFAYPMYPYGGGFGNAGFGDGSWIWIILILALFCGWGNNGNGGFGGGFNNEYAFLSNGQKEIMQNTNNGFNTLHLSDQVEGVRDGIYGLSNQLCNCCSDTQSTIANGFYNAEIAANNRAVNQMQDTWALSRQFADCCCDNKLGIANLTSTILAENCADRAALAEGVRDIVTNQTANTQRILDQLCQDKIDAKNEKIVDLQREILMKDLQASQVAQTADLRANNATVANQLVAELRSCPIPAQPVYGNTPIFTCSGNSGCGCSGVIGNTLV